MAEKQDAKKNGVTQKTYLDRDQFRFWLREYLRAEHAERGTGNNLTNVIQDLASRLGVDEWDITLVLKGQSAPDTALLELMGFKRTVVYEQVQVVWPRKARRKAPAQAANDMKPVA
jgi:hypothetical protein